MNKIMDDEVAIKEFFEKHRDVLVDIIGSILSENPYLITRAIEKNPAVLYQLLYNIFQNLPSKNDIINLSDRVNEIKDDVAEMREKSATKDEISTLIEVMKNYQQSTDKKFEDLIHFTGKRFEDLIHFTDKRFEDIIEIIKTNQQNTNRRFEEMNVRFQEMREETNRRFEEMREETNKRFQEIIHFTDKRFEEMNKRLDLVTKLTIAFNISILASIIAMLLRALGIL
jgi:DNA anti-recombination protein RmuC